MSAIVETPIDLTWLGEVARDAHGRCQGFLKKGLDAAVECGEALSTVHATVVDRHEWRAWLKENTTWGQSKTTTYIKIYRDRETLAEKGVDGICEAMAALVGSPRLPEPGYITRAKRAEEVQARLASGASQAEVARQLGLSRSQVARTDPEVRAQVNAKSISIWRQKADRQAEEKAAQQGRAVQKAGGGIARAGELVNELDHVLDCVALAEVADPDARAVLMEALKYARRCRDALVRAAYIQ